MIENKAFYQIYAGKKVLGWASSISLEEELKRTYSWTGEQEKKESIHKEEY